MKRPRIAILLILALLLAPLAPVTAAWSCPDGSVCVPDRQAYRCEKDAPAADAALPDCCVRKVAVTCHHGHFPGEGAPAGPEPILQAPDHCRYTVSAPLEIPALVAAAALQLLTVALPELPLGEPARPVAQTVGWTDPGPPDTGPPLLRRTGPSRAPPTA